MEKQHNYIAKMLKFAKDNPPPPGEVSEVGIAHDDWCGIHKEKRCDCDPDVFYIQKGDPTKRN